MISSMALLWGVVKGCDSTHGSKASPTSVYFKGTKVYLILNVNKNNSWFCVVVCLVVPVMCFFFLCRSWGKRFWSSWCHWLSSLGCRSWPLWPLYGVAGRVAKDVPETRWTIDNRMQKWHHPVGVWNYVFKLCVFVYAYIDFTRC